MHIEGKYINRIKAMYDNPSANIILNCEKLEAFPLRSGTKKRIPTLTAVIQDSIRSPNQSKQAKKRNKRHTHWKLRSHIVTFCRKHDFIM